MIVVDASVVVELLLQTSAARSIESRLFLPGETLHAPHLLDVEVAQVIRRYHLSGQLDAERGENALNDLSDLGIERYGHGQLLPRAWELRNSMTAYDAVYVSLAEVLDAPLLTRDTKLARAKGHQASIHVV